MGKASNRKKTKTRAERLGATRSQAPRGFLDIVLHVTAYHEASHIACAEALGHRVQQAWVDLRGRRDPYGGGQLLGFFEIDAPAWSRGTLSPADLADPARWRYMYSRLIVGTAGLIGELLYCRRTGIERPPDPESDRDQVVPLAEIMAAVPNGQGGWMLGPLADTLLPRAMDEAKRIITERWAAVEALASELMRKGDLTGDEVRAALAPHGGLRPALHLDWPEPGTAVPTAAAG
jgi:hypothetical protein